MAEVACAVRMYVWWSTTGRDVHPSSVCWLVFQRCCFNFKMSFFCFHCTWSRAGPMHSSHLAGYKVPGHGHEVLCKGHPVLRKACAEKGLC